MLKKHYSYFQSRSTFTFWMATFNSGLPFIALAVRFNKLAPYGKMDICSSGKKSHLASKRTKFTIRVTVGRRDDGTASTSRMQMAPLQPSGRRWRWRCQRRLKSKHLACDPSAAQWTANCGPMATPWLALAAFYFYYSSVRNKMTTNCPIYKVAVLRMKTTSLYRYGAKIKNFEQLL